MYTITISVPTLDHLSKLAAAAKSLNENDTQITPVAPPAKETKVPKSETKTTAPTAVIKASETPDKALLDQVKEVTKDLSLISREIAVEALKKFNATKTAEKTDGTNETIINAAFLKPEHFSDYIAHGKSVIESHKNPALY